MKILTPFFISSLISFCGYCQSVSIELISSGGINSVLQNGSVSQSIGECIVSGENNPAITNSGFQQGISLITSIGQIENENHQIKITAYPNPTLDDVRLKAEGDFIDFHNWKIDLFSSDYRLIESKTTKVENQIIPLKHLPVGMYFLQVSSKNTRHFFKIIKN
jgi:hypothetical protein